MTATLRELLENLGLTEYESRAISTLSSLGEGQAPEISRLSQVPKTRVYDVLDKLVKKNLVIEMSGRPKQYRALDTKKVFDNLILEKKSEINAIEEKATEYASSIAAIGKESTLQGETVMKVKDARDFEKILGQEIQKAKNSIVAFSEITDKHHTLIEAIAKAKENNVKIRMLNAFSQPRLKKAVNKLKQAEHGLNAFLIDGKKVVMALSDFKRESPEYHFAIWHNNKPIVSVLQHYFEKLWTEGSDK